MCKANPDLNDLYIAGTGTDPLITIDVDFEGGDLNDSYVKKIVDPEKKQQILL